jgi:hypothetical protein
VELSGVTSAGLKRASLGLVQPKSRLHIVYSEQTKIKCWHLTGHQATPWSRDFLERLTVADQPSNPPHFIERRTSFTLWTSIGR